MAIRSDRIPIRAMNFDLFHFAFPAFPHFAGTVGLVAMSFSLSLQKEFGLG